MSRKPRTKATVTTIIYTNSLTNRKNKILLRNGEITRLDYAKKVFEMFDFWVIPTWVNLDPNKPNLKFATRGNYLARDGQEPRFVTDAELKKLATRYLRLKAFL